MGTHHKGPDREVRALNAYIALMRATQSTTARVHAHLAEENLTLAQFAALEALYHLGPMVQRELARKLLCSAGNLTVVLGNLEKRDLVRRDRRSNDRRCTTARITPRGTRLVRKVFPRHVEALVRDMAVLTPAEQEELRRLCRKLGLQRN
jgi:MarR family 2-MHQ and catechol resistance regulon transcriptional repressor